MADDDADEPYVELDEAARSLVIWAGRGFSGVSRWCRLSGVVRGAATFPGT
jgi:hypothetical protein